MEKSKYRLDEFIITEYDRFLLTWEAHIAIGAQRSGNGFIIGDILVIGHWNHEEAGYLKLEFNEKMMKLPVWNRTRYYCLSSSLRDVNTGQKLSDYFNRQQVNKDKISIGPVKIPEPGIFRLGRYRIIVEENSKISWQTYEGLNKTIGGPCVTESGILFIGSKKNDLYESRSKKEWFSKLKLLPQWDKTFAWSHWRVLRSCRPGKELNKSRSFIWNSVDAKIRITNNMALSKRQEHKKERSIKILPSNFERLKMSWYQAVKWKEWWDRLSPLLIDGLLVGLRIFLFIIEKIAHWLRKIEEYFREHSKK
jgi:hypothetical protein